MKNSTNKKVQQLNPEKNQNPIVERKVKTEALAKSLINTIKTESEKHGDFTIHELTDVLVKILHSYNKRFLDADNARLMNQENPDKG